MSKAAVEAADRFMGGLLQRGVTRDEVAAWLDEYARTVAIEAYCAAGARSHRWTPTEVGEMAERWWNDTL